MRNYELVTIFNTKSNGYITGLEQVKEILKKRNAAVSGEEDMGDRELAYDIKGEERGHYHLFRINAEPDTILGMEEDLKLNMIVLKYLFVNKED